MADETPGLRDIVSSTVESVGKLGPDMKGVAEAARRFATELADGKITLDHFRTEMNAVRDVLRKHGEVDAQAALASVKLNDAFFRLDKSATDLTNTSVRGLASGMVSLIESAGDAAKSLTAVASAGTGQRAFEAVTAQTEHLSAKLVALGVAVSGAGLSAVAMTALGIPLAALASPLVIVGLAVAALGAAFVAATGATKASVDASDRFSAAHKEAYAALIQSGAAVSGHTDELKAGAVAINAAAARFGFAGEEGGAVAAKMRSLGIPVDRLATFVDSAGKAYAGQAAEVAVAAQAARGLGISLDLSSRAEGMFRLSTNATTMEVRDAFAGLKAITESTGVPIGRLVERASEAAQIVGRFGGSTRDATILSGQFTDALNRGVLSMKDLVDITRGQTDSAQGVLKQLALMEQAFPEQMKNLGFVGDEFKKMGHMMALQSAGDPRHDAFLDLMSQLPRELTRRYTAAGEDQEEAAAKTSMILAAAMGKNVTDFDTLTKVYNDGLRTSTMEHKLSTDAVAKANLGMAANAKAATDGLLAPMAKFNAQTEVAAGSFERLNRPLAEVAASMAALAAASEATGVTKAASAAQVAGGSLNLSQSIPHAMKFWSDMLPGRQTGGMIPDTGPYMLHAGERVIREGGGGGGINITLGGINVSASEQGDLKGQLHAALARLEDQIYEKIEGQWRSATLAM